MHAIPECRFDLEAVKNKLGLSEVPLDLEGLKQVYRAWCLNVPFDNIYKTNALFRNPGEVTPYTDEEIFFQNYLEHGISGTCWPHGNAIYSILRALGFKVTRATASMFEMGPANHSTTLVHFEDGSTWLMDNAFLTMEPLRIDPEAPSLIKDGHNYAEVEITGDGTVYVHGTNPPMPHIFFRLLDRDVTADDYRERWQTMSSTGPFNAVLNIRRNFEDHILVMRGAGLFRFDESGLSVDKLDAEGIKHHLHHSMGVSKAFIEEWSQSGALESSLQPPGEMPDLPVRVPPSKR